MSKDDRAVEPTEALTVVEAVVLDAEDDDADPASCTICGGPVRICGGTRRCLGGHLRPLERRWVTAIRLVYAGLCLTPTVAALWGGTLLRLAELLTRGLSVSPAFVPTAAEHTDPGGALPSEAAAHLAVAYLQHRDVARLDELFRSLRDADAPWLAELRLHGPRAALATPLPHEQRVAVLRKLPGIGPMADDVAHAIGTLPADALLAMAQTLDVDAIGALAGSANGAAGG